MRRRKNIKANFDRKRFERVLVTETAPAEVPIIFSNDGFYTNMLQLEKASEGLKEIIRAIVVESPLKYTIPYRYKIMRNARAPRQLSLIHPAAQFSVCKFYRQYENLICYYCGKSEFSIRYPAKTGSSYFYKGTWSEKNMYKSDTIDTVSMDKAVRNPASYFAYKHYDRFYKFFDSGDFIRLEKKYRSMMFLDISNCFGSIYTHSISWALKDIHHAKENIPASSFGNNFDKLMQRMNFNETSGICIGPEVSRIFAEIILQRVDSDVITAAIEKNLRPRIQFECRRYVDDYIIFAESDETAQRVHGLIGDHLTKFNLHINEQKIERYSRPFQTKKSQIIEDVKQRLANFLQTLFAPASKPHHLLIPKWLYRPSNVAKEFITRIKSSCFDRGVGYETVGPYVISSLGERLERLIESYAELDKAEKPDDDYFVRAFMVMLEVIYFLYTVEPTVAASLRVAKATTLSLQFFRSNLPDRTAFLSEKLSNWLMLIVRSTSLEVLHRSNSAVPIEVINILLAVGEADSSHFSDSSHLEESVFNIDSADYFSLVSCLFYVKDDPRYRETRTRIETRIRKDTKEKLDVLRNAHDAHLILDILCCPFLDAEFRTDILDGIRARCGLPSSDRASLRAVIQEMQSKPWFVRWESVDLLNMIRKKELSAVY